MLVPVHYQQCQCGLLTVAVRSQKIRQRKKEQRIFRLPFFYVIAVTRNSDPGINSTRK